MHKTKGGLSTPCPSIPVGLQKESRWPPSVLSAFQGCTGLVQSCSGLPHTFVMTVIPFACTEWKSVPGEEEQRLGGCKPPCCGLQGVSGCVLGGAAFLFSPIETHVVPQTAGRSRGSKPTAGVLRAHRDPGEVALQKWSCYLAPCESASAADTTIYLDFSRNQAQS